MNSRIIKSTLPFVISAVLVSFLYACGKTSTTAPSSSNSSSPQLAVATQICPPTTPPFATGSGTATSPYVITKFCDLVTLANNNSYWSDSFEMGADIDLSGLNFSPMIHFQGTFDGKGHTIANWSGANALFVANSGTIQNLNLAHFTIAPFGGARPALLVGTNRGTGSVINCTANGSINGIVSVNVDMDNDIYWFVGGLVSINAGTITHSSAAVTVSGRQSAGGLVGYNNGGTIQTSSATGSVTVEAVPSSVAGQLPGNGNGTQAGGLVGTFSSGTIENCYATGAVSGIDQLGGLVGAITGSGTATVENSFSSGTVTGTGSNVGGLVGENSGGTATSSYWDETASGQGTSPVGTGETTAAMETAATFAGWDFSATWNAPAGGDPTLQ